MEFPTAEYKFFMKFPTAEYKTLECLVQSINRLLVVFFWNGRLLILFHRKKTCN